MAVQANEAAVSLNLEALKSLYQEDLTALAKISCFLLCVLLAGSQCAPAKVEVGGEVGGSATASLTGELSGNLGHEGAVLKPGAKAMVGTNGEVEGHSGGYARYNDHVIAGDASGHAEGGLLGQSEFEGEVGYNGDKGLVLGGTNQLTGAVDGKAGGHAGIRTNEDALGHVRAYGGRSALDQLRKNGRH